MAFKMGSYSIIKLDNAAGTLVDISTYVKSVDGLPGAIDIADTSTMGVSAHTSVPGLKDGAKVSVDGNFDPTADTIFATIHNNGGQLTAGGPLSLEFAPHGTASTNPKYTAECWLSNYTTSAAVTDVVQAKIELTVTGGVTRSAY